MKNTKNKKYKLKSKETLEKMGRVYFESPSDKSLILTDGKEVFKHFPPDCFKKTYSIAESDKILEPEMFKRLKDLFEEIDEEQ